MHTLAPYFFVGSGGILGAIARYMVILFSQRIWGLDFPYGTLIVNALGSLIAGLLLSLMVQQFTGTGYWRLFLFTGFLGAFTTFSSFAVESLFMFEQGQWLKLFANIFLNNIAALLMVFLGSLIARNIVFCWFVVK